MTKRILYYVFMPEILSVGPNDPPIPTLRGTLIPVVNCPMIDRGDRFLAEQCMMCEYNKSFGACIECSYQPSQKEKDEIDRRKKGVGQTVKQPIEPVKQKAAETPKNVFVPNKKK